MSLKERFTSLLKEAYKIPNKNILQILSVLNESKIILSSIFSKKENIDFILSQNILEYLKRFSARPNLSIQMLILKLYIILLKNSNFYPSITTNNLKLSIDLINEIISIIEKFENLLGNDIYELKRCLLNFLKFIYINYKDELKERKDEIFEMINDIQNRFFSESYNKVIVKFNPILNGDLNLDINLINDILINAKNLNEQFEIINCIFNHNKIDYSKIKNSETLINYGKLFMKFITNEKYIFQTIENNNNNENNIINNENNNNDNIFEENGDFNTFLLLDAVKKSNNKIQNNSNETINSEFLNNKKFYLTNYYNNINNSNIKNILNEYITYVENNKNNFGANNNNINNIIIFLKRFINETEKKINLNNFNIDLGFMTKLTINSGDKNSFYINNEYENSLIFIEFEIEDNSELDKDIIFKLYKYFNNNNDNISENNNNNENDDEIEEKNFKLLFDSQRMDKLTKIILFCQKSNLYKIEFDNSYSWIRSKNILYRFVILKMEGKFNLYQNNLLNDDKIYFYYEKLNRTFLMKEIDNDIKNYSNDNIHNIFYINIILYLNKIRIVNYNEEKKNYIYNEFIDDNNDKIITNEFLNKIINEYLNENKINNNNIKINFFNININLPFINDYVKITLEKYNNSPKEYDLIYKIGFLPKIIINEKNIDYNLYNLSDISMFYHIYSCYLNKIYISNSIILINFDKYTLNVTGFCEGGIYNKMKGIEYNKNDYKNFKENIIKFIKNVNDNYDGIDLIITYCDIESIKDDVNEIINDISTVCYSVDPAIKMKVYGDTILRDLFLYNEIFFREKNCVVREEKKDDDDNKNIIEKELMNVDDNNKENNDKKVLENNENNVIKNENDNKVEDKKEDENNNNIKKEEEKTDNNNIKKEEEKNDNNNIKKEEEKTDNNIIKKEEEKTDNNIIKKEEEKNDNNNIKKEEEKKKRRRKK